MRLIYIYIFLFPFFSCTERNGVETKSSFRDSAIKFYKEEIIVNRKFDTSDFNYKLLTAYIDEDSVELKKILNDLHREKENREWWRQMDRCINLVSLNDMNIEEGYRFEYDGAMCPMRQITTIYKQKDSIKLNFSLYQLEWDTAKCRKLEEFDRVLSIENWEEFLDKIDEGDFWGLSSYNNRQGVDGSTWNITGFKKGSSDNRPSQYHFVHRWGQTTLHEAFEIATLLAANKNGCFWMRKN